MAPPHNWDEMNGLGFPMLFYGVKGQQMREGESPSYFNPGNLFESMISDVSVLSDSRTCVHSANWLRHDYFYLA